MKEVTLDA
jgi:hypothetical protein